jgi:HK97 gp10 family phage protein
MANPKITGLAELQVKLLKTIPDGARKAVQKAVVDAGQDMAELAYSLAPVDDGDLRKSIEVTGPGGMTPPYSQPGGSRQAGELEAIVTVGNNKVRYAHLVEFGSSPHAAGGRFAGAQHPGTKAQPFFFPAYRAEKRRMQSKISRAINKAVKQAAGQGAKKGGSSG